MQSNGSSRLRRPPHGPLRSSCDVYGSVGVHGECKVVQWAKRLRPEPKSRRLLPLRRATRSPWRLCCVVSREQGSLTRTLNGKEGEDLQFLASFGLISRRGKKLLDRPKPGFTCALAEHGRPRLEGWRGSRAAPWRFWVKATCSRAGFRLRVRPMARHLNRASAFP